MSYSRASLLFVLPAVLIVFGVMFGMNDTQTSTEWTLLPLDCGSLFFPVDDLPEACSFTRDGLVPFLAYGSIGLGILSLLLGLAKTDEREF